MTPTCVAPRHDMWMRRVISYFYFYFSERAARAGGGGGCQTFFFFFFPCSADHELDWPPCKVVFLGLATNALNVRNNNIQRSGCQPEKTTLHGGQSRSWSAEEGIENKTKSLAAHSPPHAARSEKKNKKSPDASTGATQVSVRLASSVQGFLRLVD